MKEDKFINLDKWIAEHITKDDNKDVKVFITGQPGSGMSYQSVAMSECIARYIKYYKNKA